MFRNITELAKHFIAEVLEVGDFAIDATAGNGNDTLFLARKVLDGGKVYSFDIQKQAIHNTRERLVKEGIINRVELFNCSHEQISENVKANVKVAMFNLGYLPKGDHGIITKGTSTTIALKQVLELLLPGGLISICIYTGHQGGKTEKEQVCSFVKKLDYRRYNVMKIDCFNKINEPPLLILIEKR